VFNKTGLHTLIQDFLAQYNAAQVAGSAQPAH
jgi:hypothetical protein